TANVGVKKVELYVDNVLTKTSTKSPFSMTWDANKATSGSHALMVKAYDGAGNVGTSAAVTVTK
ncbi:MAG: Ig-like domain-containing protein, partial [Patescibacteria group bacterium]